MTRRRSQYTARPGTQKLTEVQQRAVANAVATRNALKGRDMRVDWDTVITRFKADMAERYADEQDES